MNFLAFVHACYLYRFRHAVLRLKPLPRRAFLGMNHRKIISNGH